MAGIVCKQCGYENPEGSIICEICAESLEMQEVVKETIKAETKNEVMVSQESAQLADEDSENEYFVLCPESHTKTILPHGKVAKFLCEGCKKEHEIDDFLWVIEKKQKEISNVISNTSSQCAPKGDSLWLEEINSNFKIEIDKAGGTLGRYGKYGANFFQSRNMLTVSGEHCSFSYEFGNWVLRHLSRTNQTMYNGMILGANEPNLLEDGKILSLANTVTFTVRIG